MMFSERERKKFEYLYGKNKRKVNIIKTIIQFFKKVYIKYYCKYFGHTFVINKEEDRINKFKAPFYGGDCKKCSKTRYIF